MDANWLIEIVDNMGYWGIGLLMFLENIVPPIPSEVVMPSAGFTAKRGELNFWGVLAAGTVGSVAGTLPWYLIARWWGEERFRRFVKRHGKWLTLREKEYDRSLRWFERWGTWAVLGGRLVPTVRTLISVPAGLSKMSFGKFLTVSTVGTFLWNLLLAGLGWLVGENYTVVADSIGWIGMAIVAALAVWFVYRFWSRNHRAHASSAPGS